MPSNKLQPVILRAPGIGGLNFEGEGLTADPSFAQVAENVVFDQAGRICSRKGFDPTTSSGNVLTGTPDIEQLHMLDTSSGRKLLATATVSSTEKIYESDPSFDAYTDVTGALTPAANNWQFQNFNDKVVAAQTGETMIVKSYAGNFAAITAASGTVPDGNCVHSAFGRLWAQKGDGSGQKYVIAYCKLLDETEWGHADSGEINVLGNAGAVSKGYDELVAISSFDDYLVAFMRDSIVIYNSPDAPGSIGIQQIIQGIGCIARDSVQQTGDDIVWLSATGLRSLRHTVQSENNLELGDLSAHVRGELIQKVSQVNGDSIRSAYYPEDALYLLKTGNVIWAMDLHDRSAAGGSPPRFTQFPNNTWTSMYYHEGDLYLGTAGALGIYQNYQDDGESYNMVWETVWTDFGTSRLKSIKKLNSVVIANSNQNVTFTWETDYGLSSGSATATTEGSGVIAEWNVSEWGLGEWSGGTNLSRLSVQGSRTGEVLSFGFNITVDSNQVCIEQLGIYTTIGREAR